MNREKKSDEFDKTRKPTITLDMRKYIYIYPLAPLITLSSPRAAANSNSDDTAPPRAGYLDVDPGRPE